MQLICQHRNARKAFIRLILAQMTNRVSNFSLKISGIDSENYFVNRWWFICRFWAHQRKFSNPHVHSRSYWRHASTWYFTFLWKQHTYTWTKRGLYKCHREFKTRCAFDCCCAIKSASNEPCNYVRANWFWQEIKVLLILSTWQCSV